MCLALYIASEKPLRIIPWDELNPSFHVIELSKKDEAVKTHLNQSYVLYAGTYEGCGCAFKYGREYPEYQVDPEELRNAKDSYAQLCKYIFDAIEKGGMVQIFSCWEGNQKIAPTIFREIIFSELNRDDFLFVENELITVKGFI